MAVVFRPVRLEIRKLYLAWAQKIYRDASEGPVTLPSFIALQARYVVVKLPDGVLDAHVR
jgi:hypothetical protein